MAKITVEYLLQILNEEVDHEVWVELLNDKASEGGVKGYYAVKNGDKIRPGTITIDKKAFSGVPVVTVIVFEVDAPTQ